MAVIKINFEKKSIQQAINKIKRLTQNQDKLLYEYLSSCIKWIRNRADQRLLMIPMDGNVVADIMNGWQGEISSSQAKLINTSDKAVFVEFGVGRVAQEQPHPNAPQTGYQYNIPTVYKKGENDEWVFSPDGEFSMDLQVGYYKSKTTHSGKEWIRTNGSPASLYLFNAIEDFMVTEKAYKKLWNEAVEKVLKR